MATASSLNAISSILNGEGLGANPALSTQITTFKSQYTVKTIGNVFANADIAGNGKPAVMSELYKIGTGVTKAQWLIDYYPNWVTPASSGTLITYGNTANTASFSSTILTQAQLPFGSGGIAGMTTFANVFQTAYGYSQQVFDTISSINMLQSTQYKQTGVSYAGPADLVTGGIKTNGNLLANVVANWGTMYDIRNIKKLADPYVFGQNLLNQGFGYINGLTNQLTAVGLDTTNLPVIPAVNSTTSLEDKNITISSFVGEIELPAIEEITTTTPVTGNSPTVILNIYKTITGGNLQTIVNSANISTTGTLTTLADYLDFDKVVNANLVPALGTLGITTLTSLGEYLGQRVGQGVFNSWADLSSFLKSMETPALTNLPTGANTGVLYANTISRITSQYGAGSGELGNPVMIDYLGAVAGDPYVNVFANLNSSYSTISSTVVTAVNTLNKAVYDYGTAYSLYDADFYSNVPAGLSPPSITMISANVTALNSALNSISNSSAYFYSNLAYQSAISHISSEVNNLAKAGVTFGAGYPMGLLGFAENIGQLASDKNESQSYQFFANIISIGFAGDTIRAVVAETINTRVLGTVGISTFNDPNPRLKIYQSRSQNIPLSTYISQNK